MPKDLFPRLLLTAGTAAVLATLLLQARHSLWSEHLATDAGVYAQRAERFIETGSWAGLGQNEYQPGALFFFVLLGGLSRLGPSYVPGMFLFNGVLIALHVFVLRRLGGPSAAWLVLLFFLAAGPISLLRFELLVSLLALLGVAAAARGSDLRGGVLLGLATAVKVYPLVLLPLFLRRGWKAMLHISGGWAIGLALVLGAFLATGGTTEALVGGLRYHAEKPVSVLSVPGGIVYLSSFFIGSPPETVNTYGIHGFDLPASVTRLTTLGTIVSLLAAYTRVASPFLSSAVVLLSLIVWSPLHQPQYLLWPVAFLALLPTARVSRSRFVLFALLFTLTLLTTQVLYPTHFSAFLDTFTSERPASWLLVTFAVNMLVFLLSAVVLWVSVLPRSRTAGIHAQR